MRSKVLAVAALILCVTMSVVRAQQQFQVFGTFIDDKGAPVATLQPGDVKLAAGGGDVKVLKVEPCDWPLKVQLLVDSGYGLGDGNLGHLRAGIRGVLEALPAGAEVTLVTTAPQPHFLVRASTDHQAVLKALDLLGSNSGAGKLVDSLSEATDRIERDKGNYFGAIIVAATTAGEITVMERDTNRVLQRLQPRPVTVHVVLLTSASTTATGGLNQTTVGLAVTKVTGGRYENINSAARLATLLPEIGAQVAMSYERQRHQFRITAERPGGASGDLGRITISARGGVAPTGISFEGR